jgi:hypothetical protein
MGRRRAAQQHHGAVTREPSERGGEPSNSPGPVPPEQALDQGLFHVEKLYTSGCPDSLPELEQPSSPCFRRESSGYGMKFAWSSLLRNLPGNDRRKLAIDAQEEKSTP